MASEDEVYTVSELQSRIADLENKLDLAIDLLDDTERAYLFHGFAKLAKQREALENRND